MVPYQAFATKDGWIVVACLTEQFWVRLCSAVDRPESTEDPRFSSNGQRLAYRAELEEILGTVFSGRAASEWETVLIASGVPVAHINLLEDVLKDPQVIHNQMLTVARASSLRFGASRQQPRPSVSAPRRGLAVTRPASASRPIKYFPRRACLPMRSPASEPPE